MKPRNITPARGKENVKPGAKLREAMSTCYCNWPTDLQGRTEPLVASVMMWGRSRQVD